MYDVVIIGAGVVGSAIARELSRYNVKAVVLEGGNDVSVGTTKANSGIVHSGIDAKCGSQKSKYNVLGNGMFDTLSQELDFPFRRNGSMILCFDEDKLSELDELARNGKANGVQHIEVLSGDQARVLEPNLGTNVVGAVLAKTGGIVSPYEMCVALAENASTNGVEFVFDSKVIDIVKQGDTFVVSTEHGASYESRVVVNCAGCNADIINNMVSNNKYHIIERKGEYVLFDKTYGGLCSHTLFQLPTAMGKGVLVTPTTHGNILMGPTAYDIEDKDNVSTTVDGLKEVLDKAQLTINSINRRMIITQFAGLRAHEEGNDFVVGECDDVAGFYNCVGIESPGLTASPAIAVDIASMVAERLRLAINQQFVATRRAIPHFANMSNTERNKLIDTNPLYGNIVCRCEVVTEGEIVESINRPLGAKDLDGVKRRTRAGMGRCQAGFCTSRVMEIIARERGVSIEEVSKGGTGSEIVVGRTK